MKRFWHSSNRNKIDLLDKFFRRLQVEIDDEGLPPERIEMYLDALLDLFQMHSEKRFMNILSDEKCDCK